LKREEDENCRSQEGKEDKGGKEGKEGSGDLLKDIEEEYSSKNIDSSSIDKNEFYLHLHRCFTRTLVFFTFFEYRASFSQILFNNRKLPSSASMIAKVPSSASLSCPHPLQ
jgi:hypothetical protein